MRKRLTNVLVVGLATIAPLAFAAPDQKQPDKNPTSDDVHVTVTAGRGRLGVAVVQISPELRAHFGAPRDRGVLVDTVRPDSPAARAGVRVGDIVLEVDGDATGSASDMLEAMSDRTKGERVTVSVLRAGKRMPLTVTLTDDPGMRWQSFGSEDLGKMFPKGFEWQMPVFGDDVRKQLDDAQRQLEELTRRLEKLERT